MYYGNNLGANYPIRNGINWVQGTEGAKAFQLMPNSNTILMDSENDNVFYIKVCDNVGMCNLRTFKYEEISGFSNRTEDMSQYVTRNELKKMLEELKNEQSVSTIKSEWQLPENKYSTDSK